MFLTFSEIYSINSSIIRGNSHDIEEKKILLNNTNLKILNVSQVGDVETIEPVDSWYLKANNLINQITEPLFWADIVSQNDPNDPIELIPCLAKNYSYNEDGTVLTINLRKGIKFHDGASFNATAVVYSLERLMYWTNSSGDLPMGTQRTRPWSLYYFPNGTTPIIKSVKKTEAYQVNITLNAPFGPFINLLSYSASNIVSPNTPKTQLLNYTEGDKLVGTGAFEFEKYEPGVEYILAKNENWWGGILKNGQKIGEPYFDKIKVIIYDDGVTASDAMLNYTVDYGGVIFSQIQQAVDDPNIRVQEWGAGMTYFYWGLNSKKFSRDLRVAIAHALNISFVIEEIQHGHAVKANTSVSNALPGANQSVRPPDYNVTRAREIMNNIYGTNLDVNNDNEWLQKAKNDPFENITLFRIEGSGFNEMVNNFVKDSLILIGINTTEDIQDWNTFVDYLTYQWDKLEMWYVGWSPDYLDSYNLLNPLFNPNSNSASHQCWRGDVGAEYNNTIVPWLEEAGVEENNTERIRIFKKIQDALFDGEDAFLPHIPMLFPKLRFIHDSDLENVTYNSMQNWYWAPVTKDDTTPPTWDETPADQSIYVGDSFIYDVNASDPSGIDQYWINDTANFNIDSNGVITNATALSVGEYWLKISVNDTIGNVNTATIKITVNELLDTTPPTWDETPTDQSIYVGESLTYDVNASDPSGIDQYWINDTANFNIDSNGVITNATALSVGEYSLEISVNDTIGNINNATIKITVNEIDGGDDGDDDESPLEIPGYGLNLLYSSIAIGILTIYLKKRKMEI